MDLLAAHLNDAGIVVANAERILYREPGFALLEDDRLTTGAEAYSSARLKPRQIQDHYWSQLTTDALADRRFQHLTAADLVARQLEQIWQLVGGPGRQLAFAVPPYLSNDKLGLLLGIALDLDIPVVAMVDAAVAATRRQYEHGVPVHVDLSLHSTQLTRLLQEEQVQVDRTAVIDDGGLLALYDNWLKVIAESFVQQSRFDPLHTAETEQVLQDKLPDWLAEATRSARIPVSIDYAGTSHAAEIDTLELVAAAAPVYQSVVSQMRALFRAEETPAIQLSDRASRMPGLADTLKARVGGEVFILEPGATARGLIARGQNMNSADGVTLSRHLPWDQAPVSVAPDDQGITAGQPTHLLFGHNAYLVDKEPLVVGTQANDNERCLDLRDDMPGVSRRHCVVGGENGQVVVTDHSRYGTFLNGHRIDGSAVLQVGDVLRVGTPGFEMRLIAAESSRGA